VKYTREQLLRAYRQMKTIREFEERLHVEIQTGEIPGFTHLYSGQEAVAVGVCEPLTDEDWIASTHRGHGHCIAKGCDVPGMMLEIYGRRAGLCKGKGGSMHIADIGRGMLGANAIVGGGPPIAVGAAIACKLAGKGRVAVAFGGDGSCNPTSSTCTRRWAARSPTRAPARARRRSRRRPRASSATSRATRSSTAPGTRSRASAKPWIASGTSAPA
jgi:TPP-dependent pyruvate/acetoin dehydrogenase alpha subunit